LWLYSVIKEMTWCGIFVVNCGYIKVARKQFVVHG